MKTSIMIFLMFFVAILTSHSISISYTNSYTKIPLRENNAQKSIQAKEILLGMQQRYNSLAFYKSEGITNHVRSYESNLKSLPSTTFELTYDYQSKLNLNWKDSNNDKKYNLSIDQAEMLLKVNEKVIKKYHRINDAIFDSNTNGTTSRFKVAELLIMKDFQNGNSFINSLQNLEKLNDEIIENDSCYKIKGDIIGTATNAKATYIIWIDQISFLIKRIEKSIENKNLKVVTTETYFNVKVR